VAVIARFLIDSSAAARMRLDAVAERLEPLITGGLVATCAVLDAEALSSARSPAEYERVWADRRDAYEYLPTEDGHWQRAFDAQRVLARTGRHRAVGIADMLTAVLAGEHGMTILH
jgi:predicted nucleic acid-binding protein